MQNCGGLAQRYVMTRKRITITLFAVASVGLCIGTGWLRSRDTVRVIDVISGLPIRDARVVPIYPSFSGDTYLTDRRGVARVGGFGLPHGGYGVQVWAAGYLTNFLGTYPTSTNHNGWRGSRMVIPLEPISKPSSKLRIQGNSFLVMGSTP